MLRTLVWSRSPPSLAFPAAPDFLLALDGVQDPGNVGALIRTAAAAGVDGVVLVGACADAFNPKTIRGSAGAALRVPLAAEDSWAAAAPRLAELSVVVADAGAGAVDHLAVESWTATCLVVGAEAGLTDDLLGALDAYHAQIPEAPPTFELAVSLIALQHMVPQLQVVYLEQLCDVLTPGRGNALIFLGRVWHEAVPITRGERFVLVGLLNRRAGEVEEEEQE